MRRCHRALLCLLLIVVAVRADEEWVPATGGLLDSYIQLANPKVSLDARRSGRPGTMPLTLQLSESSVNKYSSVISPQAVEGITVDVLNTWDAFKVCGSWLHLSHMQITEVNDHPQGQPGLPHSKQTRHPCQPQQHHHIVVVCLHPCEYSIHTPLLLLLLCCVSRTWPQHSSKLEMSTGQDPAIQLCIHQSLKLPGQHLLQHLLSSCQRRKQRPSLVNC